MNRCKAAFEDLERYREARDAGVGEGQARTREENQQTSVWWALAVCLLVVIVAARVLVDGIGAVR